MHGNSLFNAKPKTKDEEIIKYCFVAHITKLISFIFYFILLYLKNI
jgi:hypothetical protein